MGVGSETGRFRVITVPRTFFVRLLYTGPMLAPFEGASPRYGCAPYSRNSLWFEIDLSKCQFGLALTLSSHFLELIHLKWGIAGLRR